MLLLRVALAFLGGVAGGLTMSRAADEGFAPSPAVTNAPAIHTAVLPNGVRYLVLPHHAPRGGISLQLLVAAGSIDERDGERGFAHFVEHMGFNGTRHHTPGTLTALFQRLGLTPGADLNASTNYTATVYKLFLPADRTDHLDLSLQLLRDYADGMTFASAEVESEKGIILSELRARDSGSSRVQREMTEILYRGTPFAEYPVIGLAADIQGATAEKLRAFYNRCYRPERMTLIVAGDVDPAAIAKKIAAEFGSLFGNGPAAPVVPHSPLPVRKNLEARGVVNPTNTAAVVSLVVVKARTAETPESRRQELMERVATAALQRRLRERREKNPDLIGDAGASFTSGIAGLFIHHAIHVHTASSRWTGAVNFAESELRRARVQGFTQAETDEAVAGLLTPLRNRAQSFSSLSLQQLAQELVATTAAGRIWRSPALDLAFAETELAGVVAEEITQALNEMFPAPSVQLVVNVPKAIKDGQAQALAAYHKSAQQPLPAPAETVGELHFRYEDFGPPGKVASERLETDLGLTLARFSNDVRLNLRPSTLEPNRFLLRANVGSGILDLSKFRPGLGQLGYTLFMVNDLGRHPRSEIERLFKLRGVNARFDLVDNSFVATFSGPSPELPFALQILTAFLSDLKLDPARQRHALSRHSGLRRAMLSTPSGVARVNALHRLSGNDRRLFPAPIEEMKRYKVSESADWVRGHWLQGPLEIGIVGDFATNEIVHAAAKSVGTLPRRRSRPSETPRDYLSFTTNSGTEIMPVDLPASAATAFLAWPAHLLDLPTNNGALHLAADVLRDRLRVKFREELGVTYSPVVNLSRYTRQRDFGFLWAELTFEPKHAKAMADLVVTLANELATNGVTDEEFQRLKAPRQTRNAEQMRDNNWWLSAVTSAQTDPNSLLEVRQHRTVYDPITLEAVNQAAQLLNAGGVTGVVAVPAASGVARPAPATPATPAEP